MTGPVPRAHLLAAVALGVAGCASTPPQERPPENAAFAATRDGLASKEVTLSDWGLESIAALQYARVGVLLQEPAALVVYHLGATDPTHRPGEPPRSAAPPMSGGRFTVADMRAGNRNELGGYFNGFSKAPATASVAIDESAAGERALVFDYDKRPGTFTGFWVHLFDSSAARQDRVYVDGRAAAWLTFEVRGDAGGEPLRLQLADAAWETREDSVPVDDLGSFLPGKRVETTWQRAWVPLDKLPPRLNRAELASLVLLVDPEGRAARKGRVWLRDVAFTETQVAPPPAPVVEHPAVAARAEKKAMWLWETGRILASEKELAELVAFCVEHGFTDVFAQIPYSLPRVDKHWGPRWDEDGMRRFVSALRAAGVSTHALDGAAWYARPKWHRRVLETVGQVAAYNRTSPPEARFVGIRFDIEPYLLPEWQGSHREVVLRDYLTLLAAIVPLAHGGGLVVGVDIPFWFDARDEVSGELAAPVDGRSGAEAIIDLVDNIGVMDYRTVAYGADGVIAHGEGELTYASRVGKQVFLGLETVPLPDERQETWDARPRSEWDVSGDLVVEPGAAGRATLTYVPKALRRTDGRYPWLKSGAMLLRRRDSLMVPATKITFASQGTAELDRTLRLTRQEVRSHASFAGFVLHSYESLRPWLGSRRSPDDSARADATKP